MKIYFVFGFSCERLVVFLCIAHFYDICAYCKKGNGEVFWGTYKVRNEIETKRNETKRNQRKRNETKRNETKSTKTKRNVTKSTKWKRNETKPTK